MRHNTWHPILNGALGERALEVIHDIADALREPPLVCLPQEAADVEDRQGMEDASLAGGRAGLAILFATLAQARSGYGDDETAMRFLNEAIVAVSMLPMLPSLYSGFTGVAWAVAHLDASANRRGSGVPAASDGARTPLNLSESANPPSDDPNEAIDEALIQYLSQSPWRGEYDLISGLVGIGVYALERLPRPSAVICLERVLNRLDETAERSREGIAWFTPPEHLPDWQRTLCPDGYYNLGLAHGVPGVIALLGGACAANVLRAKAQPLLEGAVSWLLRQKLPEGAGSSFSSWAGPGVERDASRLAWCYGDVGLAAALLVAARCTDNPDWEREAVEIMRRAAERSLEQAGIVDAGLCHGAAGLGHLFNRMFQTTGEMQFKEAGQFWFERTLEMRQPNQGIAGYSGYLPLEDGTPQWVADPGILTGAAGIALALLATTTSIEPAWDRMMLVSVPA